LAARLRCVCSRRRLLCAAHTTRGARGGVVGAGRSLETIAGLVPWESFRADIDVVILTPEEAKSKTGRKPLDALVLFRMLVLQALYNLSDEQIEYQVRDRLSFTRFLGLALRTAYRTVRRCGCSARSWRRPG
jgi:hypothetical protein